MIYHSCEKLSAIPTIKHGFFGKNSGMSEGIFSSLNCGFGSNDDANSVRKNRSIVASALGFESSDLCTVHQIHSHDAVIVNEPHEHKNAPQADALVTNKKGILLGILTADCLPILFADGKNQVIAAAHAGWKGAFTGVIEQTIEKMLSLGAETSQIQATIGPAISEQSYEVGAEFYGNFINQSPDNKQFFLPSDNDKYLFNLPEYAKYRLKKAGISQINIIAKDTYFNDNDFFSYRRSCKRGEPDYGRQISAIGII